LIGVAVIWRFFPETKGLTLEEIGVLFGDEITHEVGIQPGHVIDGSAAASEVTDGKSQGTEKISVTTC
jgi:hypothetical protein